MQGLILTAQGQRLLTSVLAENSIINFTTVKTSDSKIESSEIEDMKDLVDIKQSATLTSVTKVSKNAVRLEVKFNGAGLANGYYVKNIGVYANDGVNEILFGVGIEDQNVYMNVSTVTIPSTITYAFIINVTNSDIVNVISPDTVTNEQLNEKLQYKGNVDNGRIYYKNDVINDGKGNFYIVNSTFTSNENIDFSKVTFLSKTGGYDNFDIELDFANFANPNKENGGIKYSGGCENFSVDDWVEWIGYKPCVLSEQGAIECWLDPYNYNHNTNGANVDISTVSTTPRNVMIMYPRIGYTSFYNRMSKKGIIRITNNPSDSSYSYAAFDRKGKKGNRFYAGAYSGYVENDKLHSVSGVTSNSNGSLSGYRTYAQSNGVFYKLIDHRKMVFFQHMFIVQNGKIDGKLSQGYDINNLVTGQLNESGMNVTTINSNRRKYLGMESCCLFEVIDGCGIDNNRNICICMNDEFNDTLEGYDNLGTVYTCGSGYKGTSVNIDEICGFIATSLNGTSDTYFRCPEHLKVTNTIEVQGGSNVFETRFAWGTSTNQTFSARLCYEN